MEIVGWHDLALLPVSRTVGSGDSFVVPVHLVDFPRTVSVPVVEGGVIVILMIIDALLYRYLLRKIKKFSDEAKKKFGHIIRYVEVGEDEITLTLLFGRIVLKDIESVEHVTPSALASARYTVPQKDGADVVMVSRYGLSMQVEDFVDPNYGAFTRICNNFSELAMVTCRDGKRYLINYPGV